MPQVSIPGVGVVHFPYDMPPDQIAAQAKRLHDEAQGQEAPLTRQRQSPGTPSALESGHHPDSLVGGPAGSREVFGRRLSSIYEDAETASDAAFLKRGPEVGGAAGMVLGGPLGAAAGAALGSLAKGQHASGMHVPTKDDLATAAGEGGLSGLLAGAPGMLARGARTIGPLVAKHAKPISKTISTLTGGGALIASGNPLMALGAGAAAKAVTSPQGIRTAGNRAARAGSSVPAHAAQKAGFGALSAEAIRRALLDALGNEEQP